MRVALFGDIHGNLPALERVLEHARSMGAHAFWDLGDLTGYGPCPDEVVRVVAGLKGLSVLGNYDRKVLLVEEKRRSWAGRKDPDKILAFQWAHDQLSPEARAFLEALPEEREFGLEGLSFFLTHAAPGSRKEHLSAETPRERFLELAAGTGADVVCVAHSPSPFALRAGAAWFDHPQRFSREVCKGLPRGADPRRGQEGRGL